MEQMEEKVVATQEPGTPAPKVDPARQKWAKIEIFGLILLIAAIVSMIFWPDMLSGVFNSIVAQAFAVSVQTFIMSDLGIAIVASVIVGRLLERLGLTDALIRVFMPVMKWMKINPSVIVPSVYNILGDINASGAVAGPILVKANATKDEQKIAVTTMIQNPQSFSTFVLGLVALRAFNIQPVLVVLLSIFLPLVIIPFLLSRTIYRDTKAVTLEELPRFTPDKSIMNTLFDSSAEGMKLWLLVIVPAVTVVFSIIGVLDYIGIWTPIQTGLGAGLKALSIEPTTGLFSFFVAPTLAMSQLAGMVGSIDPRFVVGGFVLANSGLPLSVIFGQVPSTWKEYTSLTDKETMKAAILGTVIRVLSAALIAYAVTPLVV